MFFDLFIFFFYINITAYFLLIFWFVIGLLKIKYFSADNPSDVIKNVSVIVCVKNGEKSLKNLLDDLKLQDYKGSVEFIIVDDNSSDKTSDIISDYMNEDKRFRYVHSREGNKSLCYKKRALDAGIQNANHEILLFTDVDCEIGKSWGDAT